LRRLVFISGCHAHGMTSEELRVDDVDRTEIAASEAELLRLEPEVDGAVIHSLVQDVYDDLIPAKVHNYLPILIVREVRDILRGRHAA